MSERPRRQRRRKNESVSEGEGKFFSALVKQQTPEQVQQNLMWVPDDEEGFVVGEITERHGEDIDVILSNGQVSITTKYTSPFDPYYDHQLTNHIFFVI